MPAETGRDVPARPLAALAALGRMAGSNLVGRVISTPDGIRNANDAFLRITGFTREEMDRGRVTGARSARRSGPAWTTMRSRS